MLPVPCREVSIGRLTPPSTNAQNPARRPTISRAAPPDASVNRAHINIVSFRLNPGIGLPECPSGSTTMLLTNSTEFGLVCTDFGAGMAWLPPCSFATCNEVPTRPTHQNGSVRCLWCLPLCFPCGNARSSCVAEDYVRRCRMCRVKCACMEHWRMFTSCTEHVRRPWCASPAALACRGFAGLASHLRVPAVSVAQWNWAPTRF